jgi:hypothetical protein
MSWFSSLFGGKKESNDNSQQQAGLQTQYDPFASTRGALNTWLTDQVGKTGPQYTGDRVAPMSDQEKGSLTKLDQYNNYDPSNDKTFNLSRDEINKTLSGDYDPSTSPYYQAVKAQAALNMQDTNRSIDAESAKAGRYYGGANTYSKGRANAEMTNNLNNTLGTIAQQERQNRLTVLPQALASTSFAQNVPLQQAQADQQLGQLPRQLGQANLDATYQQWVNSNYDWPLNIAQLSTGPSTQQPIFTYQPQTYNASAFNQIAPGVGQMAQYLPYFAQLLGG